MTRQFDDVLARTRRLLQTMKNAVGRWQAELQASSAPGDASETIEQFDAATEKLEAAYEEMQRAIEAKLEQPG